MRSKIVVVSTMILMLAAGQALALTKGEAFDSLGRMAVVYQQATEAVNRLVKSKAITQAQGDEFNKAADLFYWQYVATRNVVYMDAESAALEQVIKQLDQALRSLIKIGQPLILYPLKATTLGGVPQGQ